MSKIFHHRIAKVTIGQVGRPDIWALAKADVVQRQLVAYEEALNPTQPNSINWGYKNKDGEPTSF